MHGWINALVVGGNFEWRLAVARQLHRTSAGPRQEFLALDPERDGEALTHALAAWMGDPQGESVIRPVAADTLFIDRLETLSRADQSALSSVAERIIDGRVRSGVPSRIIAGASEDPWHAVEAGRLLQRLCDCLDKFRIEAPARMRRSVA